MWDRSVDEVGSAKEEDYTSKTSTDEFLLQSWSFLYANNLIKILNQMPYVSF